MTDKLRAWIHEQGMTQRDCAKQLGITEYHLSRLLNGHYPIGSTLRGRFADAFGYDVAQQVFGNGKEREAA